VESRKWYKHSEETKLKIGNAHRGILYTEERKQKLRKPKLTKRINFKHSDKTKLVLSEICKNQWLTGVHKPIFKSKGHIEIMGILSEFGFNIEDEYVVCGKPFDVYIKNTNTLIEFNGTFWHRDPRFYTEEEGKCFWDKDKLKIDNAIKCGYTVKTIWQHDWENCDDKKKLIGDILNGTN
jgi:hypothetical protein